MKSFVSSLACLFFVLLWSAAWAQPDKGSLIAAWERLQLEDPSTEVFEKVEDRLYRFKTGRFPFDGRMRLVNASIDSVAPGDEGGYILGVVEVELQGVEEEFYRTHSFSYSNWQRDNMLYYDSKEERWLTYAQWEEALGEYWDDQATMPWYLELVSGPGFLLVILVVFLVLAFWLSRKSGSHMKRALAAQDQSLAEQAKAMDIMRRSIALQEDNNRLLGEILEALKKG